VQIFEKNEEGLHKQDGSQNVLRTEACSQQNVLRMFPAEECLLVGVGALGLSAREHGASFRFGCCTLLSLDQALSVAAGQDTSTLIAEVSAQKNGRHTDAISGDRMQAYDEVILAEFAELVEQFSDGLGSVDEVGVAKRFQLPRLEPPPFQQSPTTTAIMPPGQEALLSHILARGGKQRFDSGTHFSGMEQVETYANRHQQHAQAAINTHNEYLHPERSSGSSADEQKNVNTNLPAAPALDEVAFPLLDENSSTPDPAAGDSSPISHLYDDLFNPHSCLLSA
jgi:hypothetical protein